MLPSRLSTLREGDQVTVSALDLMRVIERPSPRKGDLEAIARMRRPLERMDERRLERDRIAEIEREALRAAGYDNYERDVWRYEETDGGPRFSIAGMRSSLYRHMLSAASCDHAAGQRVCESCDLITRP